MVLGVGSARTDAIQTLPVLDIYVPETDLKPDQSYTLKSFQNLVYGLSLIHGQ